MGRMGKFNIDGLKKFRDELNKLQDPDVFIEACAKELAARLLRLVIPRTPVGKTQKELVDVKDDAGNTIVYKNGKNKGKAKQKSVTVKTGGTLRRGWISNSQQEAENGKGQPQVTEILAYVNGIEVSRTGNIYKIEIINPVEYASYVEYGHRQTPGRYVPALGKKLKRGWVKGQLMMTKSEQDLQTIAPKVLENKIKEYLKECLK